jgi:hypothetical protein
MVIKAPKGKAPYAGTPVSVETSKMQISKLLRDYGASGVIWGDNFTTGEVSLQFAVAHEDGHLTSYRITPTPFMEEHNTWSAIKGRTEAVRSPNWPRTMRLLLAVLKAKLESVAFGLTVVEEEFLAHTVVRDAHGKEARVGDLVLHALEMGGGQLALEAPRKREGAVDAESHEVR